MKIEKIKPTPKYILAKIKKLDESRNIKPCGQLRFYSYLTKNDGDLCRVTVAVKIYKKVWYCKQVAVHGLHSDTCFVHDMEYAYMGGYKVDFYSEGSRQFNAPAWYAKGKWYEAEDKYYNPTFAPIVNLDYLRKYPEFKYSAFDLYQGEDIIEYLRTYEKYPIAEMLVKLGLSRFALSKQILEKATKDKTFRKYLGRNRELLASDRGYDKQFYVSTILTAYKENKPLEIVQELETLKKEIANPRFYALHGMFKGEADRLFAYIKKQNTNLTLYRDYVSACRELGLDMTKDKNRYPHDFMHAHDVAIDDAHALRAVRAEQARIARAIEEEQERKKREQEQIHLAENFLAVASKYLPLQSLDNGAFVVYIAQSPAELVKEGEALHHCVGKLGYDKKFAKEQSLIFFVRSATDTETPLATIEYDPKRNKILQFYADHNHKPDQAVTDYVNNVWLPHANKALGKIAA